jgi:hypothetical protein
MTEGWIYFIHLTALKGPPQYKLGKTEQSIKKRMKGYKDRNPRHVIDPIRVSDVWKAETKIKQHFKKHYLVTSESTEQYYPCLKGDSPDEYDQKQYDDVLNDMVIDIIDIVKPYVIDYDSVEDDLISDFTKLNVTHTIEAFLLYLISLPEYTNKSTIVIASSAAFELYVRWIKDKKHEPDKEVNIRVLVAKMFKCSAYDRIWKLERSRITDLVANN